MNPHYLLKKLLDRTASREEVLTLLDYINKHPEEEFADTIRTEWERVDHHQEADPDLEGVYQEISRTIYTNQQQRSRRKWAAIRWAATFTLLFMAAVGVYLFVPDSEPEVTVVPTIEKANPKGQKSKIFLPDGSIVWLNAESKLLFPERFDSVRVVKLVGEAYFEVTPNQQKPFLVDAAGLTTTVLGTAFNIKAFPDETEVQVALTHGKVEVSMEEQSENHILSPGNSLTYHQNTNKIDQSPFSSAEVIGWKDGILVFENTGHTEIFKRLSRWYGVSFFFENNLPDQEWNYNGHFENEYLENVLTSIGAIKHFDFEIDNKKVNIIFN